MVLYGKASVAYVEHVTDTLLVLSEQLGDDRAEEANGSSVNRWFFEKYTAAAVQRCTPGLVVEAEESTERLLHDGRELLL